MIIKINAFARSKSERWKWSYTFQADIQPENLIFTEILNLPVPFGLQLEESVGSYDVTDEWLKLTLGEYLPSEILSLSENYDIQIEFFPDELSHIFKYGYKESDK